MEDPPIRELRHPLLVIKYNYFRPLPIPFSWYACRVVESEAEMATCMHEGQGCSPKGTPLHKCAGYFEHSFACENYVCENHVHRSRYGTYCEQCDPAPPIFAMPRTVRRVYPMAGRQGVSPVHHGAA
jgi:hypothetical protein